MSDKLTIFLTPHNRRMAADAVHKRPDGHMLVLQERTRTIAQNSYLHHLFGVAAKEATYMGRRFTAQQWKVLFISGHAIAAGIGADVIPGLEGEFVNVRESSASMGQKRMNSLLEYVQAWFVENGIPLSAPPGYEELAA